MAAAKILAFAGSTRKDSFNKKLLAVAVAGARDAGAEVTVVDLRDLPMPLYDGDLEASDGLPVNAVEFRRLMYAHQGLLIAAPEYNSGMSAVLKNAIDWASRPTADEAMLACIAGKTAAIMSASPGALGGLRGLVQLRSILSNIQVLVLPDQIAVNQAGSAFDDQGMLVDEGRRAGVAQIGAKLAKLTAQVNG